MKRRARALAAPNARDALFVKADGSGVEWKPLVGATWSADTTTARAADLAARSVRATARAADDGKYAKYVGSGSFVLASASEGIAISNGGAAQGSQGAAGHSPPGAAGLSARGAQGSGDAVGARGFSPAGAVGAQGYSPPGASGAAGFVPVGSVGSAGAAGPARGELPPKQLADATLVTGTGLFAPRAADGSMPALHAITATGYALGVAGSLLAYGVASPATALSWEIHVLVDQARVLVDRRAGQACPSGAYREYALAATPPECTEFRITFSSISGTGTALVSVLVLPSAPASAPAPVGDALPVLDIRPATVYHAQGQVYQELGVVSYHTVSGLRAALTPAMSPAITSTTGLGRYDVSYSVTNSRGTTRATRTVVVVRQPTIARVGADVITRYVGEPLADPGYTVDTKGVMLDPEVAVSNSPPTDIYRNLTTARSYDLTYTMSFRVAGYKFPTLADQTFVRTIHVRAARPTVSVSPSVVYWLKGTAYVDVGGVVSANADGGVATSGSVNTTVVGSEHTLVYTASNGAGETASATRVVRIIQEPAIALNAPSVSMQRGEVWTDPGYTATDAFGASSREVGITGVPELDAENRVVSAGTYTLTYTLRATNSPSAQVAAQVVATRTVTVAEPVGPPALTIAPKRVYHRHRDAYIDAAFSAKDHGGNDITASVTRRVTKGGSLVDLATVGDALGEYKIEYSVTHNSVTVTAARYVDVYSDLLAARSFLGGYTRAPVTTAAHPTVGGVSVDSLPGTSFDERVFVDKSVAPCDALRPFTFMAWVRIAAGQTQGTVSLLKTANLRITLHIVGDLADYFTGAKAPHVKASLYGPTWSEVYLKTLGASPYTIPYPHLLHDSGRGAVSSMHDCPRVGEWLWLSVQYDGLKHFILSLNGTRYEHTFSYYADTIHAGAITLAESSNGVIAPLRFDICNARFLYRCLHIHEIQALYEDFVLGNHKARYDAFGDDLRVVDAYVDKFKDKSNTAADDTGFETALRNIRIMGHCALQKEDGSHLQTALGIIAKFEAKHGPLFVGLSAALYQPTPYYYGLAPYQHRDAQNAAKQLHTHRLARGMLLFQHIVWDAGLQANTPYKHYFVSSEYQISFASAMRSKQLQLRAEAASWGTATYLKGQTAVVTEARRQMSIVLKVRNRKVGGILGDYGMAPVPRCTGMFVDRGAISEVTVPESMINKGIQLCVGTHMNDPSLVEGGHGGGKHGRLDRVAAFFLVDRSTVRVYNPLGGNLYVLVPYGVDVGMATLTATNVVPSRLFRTASDDVTGFHETTSEAQWNLAKSVAAGGPPTVDLETDYALVHVPSHWIEDNVAKHKWLVDIAGLDTIYKRVRDLALKYDSVCRSVAVFRGIPGLDAVGRIDHPMLYTSVDMVMRTSAGGVGWPMVNSPMIESESTNHYILNWCMDNHTMWHELGHMYCNRALAFSNEGESANEVLGIFLRNQTCGYDLDSAFRSSPYQQSSMSLDQAVVDWMKEDAFASGGQMTYALAGYQMRSWHKYMDIVALVGWDGFLAYQRAENAAFDRLRLSASPAPLDPSDTQRIVRMTVALGVDVAPLMEFWGITDPVAAKQDEFRTKLRAIIDGAAIMGKKGAYFQAYGTPELRQDCPVHRCRGVRTLLLYFKSLVPRTNKAALEYVWSSWKLAFPGAGAESLYTGLLSGPKYLNWWERFYNGENRTWDAAKIAGIESRIDAILKAHGLEFEPSAVPNCIACANNKPNFNPPSRMEACWAIGPTRTHLTAFPYSALSFYVTEDAGGFVLKGERDTAGPLSTASRMPTLQVRFATKLVFHVSTTSRFYILRLNGSQMSGVKNQGVTDGLLIWHMEEYGDSRYGNSTYRGTIQKVLGPA